MPLLKRTDYSEIRLSIGDSSLVMMKISLQSIIYMKLWTDSLGFFLEVASGWLESCFSAYHREIPPVAVTSKG